MNVLRQARKSFPFVHAHLLLINVDIILSIVVTFIRPQRMLAFPVLIVRGSAQILM